MMLKQSNDFLPRQSQSLPLQKKGISMCRYKQALQY